jgi:hypothetical protein
MAEYMWYEWVNSRDTSVHFSDSKIGLDRDLGAEIDIFAAMVWKVLTVKGEVMYHTSVRSLTSDKI